VGGVGGVGGVGVWGRPLRSNIFYFHEQQIVQHLKRSNMPRSALCATLDAYNFSFSWKLHLAS
jgi:hypothetical protein